LPSPSSSPSPTSGPSNVYTTTYTDFSSNQNYRVVQDLAAPLNLHNVFTIRCQFFNQPSVNMVSSGYFQRYAVTMATSNDPNTWDFPLEFVFYVENNYLSGVGVKTGVQTYMFSDWSSNPSGLQLWDKSIYDLAPNSQNTTFIFTGDGTNLYCYMGTTLVATVVLPTATVNAILWSSYQSSGNQIEPYILDPVRGSATVTITNTFYTVPTPPPVNAPITMSFSWFNWLMWLIIIAGVVCLSVVIGRAAIKNGGNK
jgi:hypothetical protein